MSSPSIALAVGRPNSGKTTWLAAIVQRARSRGLKIDGLLSHGLWVNGIKATYELEAVATGERRPLARMNEPATGDSSLDEKNINPTAGSLFAASAPDGKGSMITCGRFQFSRFAFDWGNKILRSSSGIIVIDEFGPLEASGNGLWPGIDYLLRHHTGPLLIAVRPSLQADLLQRIRTIKR
ncbi:MAG TPA: nucleoside-triphosphatase [bacterium]|nr:nucleoside-triphosphatase [bacterium]HPN35397.1 nucleoside-triphosphatase [bacterium]